MKKLLLLALPVCLLGAAIVRAEEAVTPAQTADQTVAAAPAPAPDPKVEEFGKIANTVSEAVNEHMKAIQDLYSQAFTDHKALLTELGKSYPNAIATLPDGTKVLVINLGSIGIGPVEGLE